MKTSFWKLFWPSCSPCNSLTWPLWKSDSTWRMTGVDYRELSKVMLPIHAAVPNIVFLMDTLSKEIETYHCVLDLANAFSILIHEESQDQLPFTWGGRQWTFQVLPQGYVHSPSYCHNLVARDLAKWNNPSNIKLYHYIDDDLIIWLAGGIRKGSRLISCSFTRENPVQIDKACPSASQSVDPGQKHGLCLAVEGRPTSSGTSETSILLPVSLWVYRITGRSIMTSRCSSVTIRSAWHPVVDYMGLMECRLNLPLVQAAMCLQESHWVLAHKETWISTKNQSSVILYFVNLHQDRQKCTKHHSILDHHNGKGLPLTCSVIGSHCEGVKHSRNTNSQPELVIKCLVGRQGQPRGAKLHVVHLSDQKRGSQDSSIYVHSTHKYTHTYILFWI